MQVGTVCKWGDNGEVVRIRRDGGGSNRLPSQAFWKQIVRRDEKLIEYSVHFPQCWPHIKDVMDAERAEQFHSGGVIIAAQEQEPW